MFKITLKTTWNKNGIPTNYIKYLNVNKMEKVYKFYNKENILNIEKCTN
jgi:hypothetical protein|tara:strand:+ start:93 stop:239 length:147 start_codon:yes stop_codon:yes gene_type:complete